MRRGGFCRPVSICLPLPSAARAFGVAILSLWLFTAGVSAHGGVPTLQLSAERISPGGTLELLGDMTTEGTVELSIVAGVTVRSLGSAVADYEGHFQAFLIVPVEIPTGSYTVHARSEVERASAPLVIAGLPISGEQGQLPGQDEIFASVPSTPETVGAPGSVSNSAPATGSANPSSVLPITLLVVAVAVGGAFAFGALVRRRAPRAPGH